MTKSYKVVKRTIMQYHSIIVYKYGQTIIIKKIASNFRGHYITKFSESKKKFFPHWELNRYPGGSKAHTLPLSHSGLVWPRQKRKICIHNSLWAQQNAETVKHEVAWSWGKRCKFPIKQRLNNMKWSSRMWERVSFTSGRTRTPDNVFSLVEWATASFPKS